MGQIGERDEHVKSGKWDKIGEEKRRGKGDGNGEDEGEWSTDDGEREDKARVKQGGRIGR